MRRKSETQCVSCLLVLSSATLQFCTKMSLISPYPLNLEVAYREQVAIIGFLSVESCKPFPTVHYSSVASSLEETKAQHKMSSNFNYKDKMEGFLFRI